MTWCFKNRIVRGFTLVELQVALLLVALIAVYGVPIIAKAPEQYAVSQGEN